MQNSKKRFVVLVGGLAIAALVSVMASGEATAARKSTLTQAVWVSFDKDGQTVTVKVKKPGRSKDAKRLRKGKEATFRVKVEGSVLTKTTVAFNGKRGELDEIPAGKTVNIYWRPDEGDAEKMFARKIDVVFSDKELEERWKAAD